MSLSHRGVYTTYLNLLDGGQGLRESGPRPGKELRHGDADNVEERNHGEDVLGTGDSAVCAAEEERNHHGQDDEPGGGEGEGHIHGPEVIHIADQRNFAP